MFEKKYMKVFMVSDDLVTAEEVKPIFEKYCGNGFEYELIDEFYDPRTDIYSIGVTRAVMSFILSYRTIIGHCFAKFAVWWVKKCYDIVSHVNHL